LSTRLHNTQKRACNRKLVSNITQNTKTGYKTASAIGSLAKFVPKIHCNNNHNPLEIPFCVSQTEKSTNDVRLYSVLLLCLLLIFRFCELSLDFSVLIVKVTHQMELPELGCN